MKNTVKKEVTIVGSTQSHVAVQVAKRFAIISNQKLGQTYGKDNISTRV